jgi:hypothetical protein
MSSSKPFRLIDLVIFVTLSLTHTIQGLSSSGSTSVRSVIADTFNSASDSSPSFDFREASRCYKSWESVDHEIPTDNWRLCYPTKTLSPSDFEPYMGTSILRTMQRFGPGSTYEDCDGITRSRFSPGASIKTSSSLITVLHRGWALGNWTTQCTVSSTASLPSCKVPPAFCDDLWASYISKLSTFSETKPFQTVPGRPVAPCGSQGECGLDLQETIVGESKGIVPQ